MEQQNENTDVIYNTIYNILFEENEELKIEDENYKIYAEIKKLLDIEFNVFINKKTDQIYKNEEQKENKEEEQKEEPQQKGKQKGNQKGKPKGNQKEEEFIYENTIVKMNFKKYLLKIKENDPHSKDGIIVAENNIYPLLKHLILTSYYLAINEKDEKQKLMLCFVGLLHDIGKIECIPIKKAPTLYYPFHECMGSGLFLRAFNNNFKSMIDYENWCELARLINLHEFNLYDTTEEHKHDKNLLSMESPFIKKNIQKLLNANKMAALGNIIQNIEIDLNIIPNNNIFNNGVIIFLCGMSGTGKSTFTKEFIKNFPNLFHIIERDNILIQCVIKKFNLSNDLEYSKYYEYNEKLEKDEINNEIKNQINNNISNKIIIIDSLIPYFEGIKFLIDEKYGNVFKIAIHLIKKNLFKNQIRDNKDIPYMKQLNLFNQTNEYSWAPFKANNFTWDAILPLNTCKNFHKTHSKPWITFQIVLNYNQDENIEDGLKTEKIYFGMELLNDYMTHIINYFFIKNETKLNYYYDNNEIEETKEEKYDLIPVMYGIKFSLFINDDNEIICNINDKDELLYCYYALYLIYKNDDDILIINDKESILNAFDSIKDKLIEKLQNINEKMGGKKIYFNFICSIGNDNDLFNKKFIINEKNHCIFTGIDIYDINYDINENELIESIPFYKIDHDFKEIFYWINLSHYELEQIINESKEINDKEKLNNFLKNHLPSNKNKNIDFKFFNPRDFYINKSSQNIIIKKMYI